MVLPVPTNQVEDYEVAWLNADLTVTGFCEITAFTRKRADGAKAADLRIEDTRERRIDQGHREIVHRFLIEISWPLVSGASSMVEDQRYLRGFCDALRARIRGTVGQHTHSGGVFLSVAENEGTADDGIRVEHTDPTAALLMETPVLTAVVRYSATELTVVN